MSIDFKKLPDEVEILVPKRLVEIWADTIYTIESGVFVRLSSDADKMKDEGIEDTKRIACFLGESMRMALKGEIT